MLVAKKIADGLTFARLILAAVLAWLGLVYGAAALPLVCALMIISWTSDCLDGILARLSQLRYRTWIGDHDLIFDMSVAVGLLLYLLLAGYVNLWLAVLYLLVWAAFFWRFGLLRSPGMLFQAPVYGWFIATALREEPLAGWIIIGWILVAIAVTWPRFPDEVIPDFLSSMGKLHTRERAEQADQIGKVNPPQNESTPPYSKGET